MKTRRVLCCVWSLFFSRFSETRSAADPPPPVIDTLISTGSVRACASRCIPARRVTHFSAARTPPRSRPTRISSSLLRYRFHVYYEHDHERRSDCGCHDLCLRVALTNATAPSGFYRVGVRRGTARGAHGNRVEPAGLGPTPDELERVTAIGPQATSTSK